MIYLVSFLLFASLAGNLWLLVYAKNILEFRKEEKEELTEKVTELKAELDLFADATVDLYSRPTFTNEPVLKNYLNHTREIKRTLDSFIEEFMKEEELDDSDTE